LLFSYEVARLIAKLQVELAVDAPLIRYLSQYRVDAGIRTYDPSCSYPFVEMRKVCLWH
jgi:hypothetical protein